MPCDECGTSLDHDEREEHACDPERRLDYQLFQQRTAIAYFDDELCSARPSANTSATRTCAATSPLAPRYATGRGP
jgi:hypothetical protein